MIKNEPIIGVHNVAKSSDWYQKLLECTSAHGGDTFDMLSDKEGGNIFMLT